MRGGMLLFDGYPGNLGKKHVSRRRLWVESDSPIFQPGGLNRIHPVQSHVP
jgi:hypothetical protein